MQLRPRYSLLTLLVLTALVAGGVKLWYGPHHVVEQTKSGEEIEFTYTRDWRGDRIIQGPWIERSYEESNPNKKSILNAITVHYYRQGLRLTWGYVVVRVPNHHKAPDNSTERDPPFIIAAQEEDPFNSQEREEYHQVIRRERLKIQPREGRNIEEFYNPREYSKPPID